MLSDTLLSFLRGRPGEAFTAAELREQVEWPGRVLPCHVQQALERRLLPEGLVVASGTLQVDGDFVRGCPRTRWCAACSAPAGFRTYAPGEGVCEYVVEEEKPGRW